MKYKLYRARYELQVNEEGDTGAWKDDFELVAVEQAPDIDRATPLLIKAITDELGTTPQYANCEVAAYCVSQSELPWGAWCNPACSASKHCGHE